MTLEKQCRPNSIKLEFTEGCNLRCTFCGMNGIRAPGDHTLRFMTVETAERVGRLAAEAGWDAPRIDCGMRGEPTLNRDRVGIVAALRAALPKAPLMIISNGGGLLGAPGPTANITELFDAGLNTLALDDYDGANIVSRIRADIAGSAIKVLEYSGNPDANPHKKCRPTEHRVVIISDIAHTTQGTHSKMQISNMTGAAAPLNSRRAGRRCAEPFRTLVVNWDGKVPLCCYDWRRKYIVGDIREAESIDELWQHARFRAARRYLYKGMRTFGPCFGCDAFSYRTGLLPDTSGRETMAEPDEDDARAIAETLAIAPATTPVLRPWEIETCTDQP